MTLKERLLEDCIYVNGPLHSQCWIWTGSINNAGYGHISFQGRIGHTHRLMWEIINGDIPPRMCICHHCDNRACLNPDHLFLGTYSDNQQDSINKGRHAIGEAAGCHVLSELDVEEIKWLLEEGSLGLHRIAKRYNAGKRTILDIKTGRTWSHVVKKTKPKIKSDPFFDRRL